MMTKDSNINNRDSKISVVAAQKVKKIMEDPVLWSQAFLRTFDPVKKKYVPWVARWYQVDMLRDKSLKKVARWGRRTGNGNKACTP